MKKTLLLGALAVMLAGGTVSVAAADYSKEIFQIGDTNSDGIISKAEFLERQEEKFTRLDADGDGGITQREMDSLKESLKDNVERRDFSGHGGKIFRRMDTNSDGVISEGEFLERAKKRFAKTDIDGDGKITVEEVEKRQAYVREKLEKLEKFKEKRRQRRGY